MQPRFFIFRKGESDTPLFPMGQPSIKAGMRDLLVLSLCLAFPLLMSGCDTEQVISPGPPDPPLTIHEEDQDPPPTVHNENQDLPPTIHEEAEENPALEPTISSRYEVCAGCHEDHYRLWENGGHQNVGCEACHGPADGHTQEKADPRPRMELRGEARLCLSCHAKSRPMINNIPRIESLEAHVKFVGEKHKVNTDINKVDGRCIFCHEPHSLE